MFHGEGGEQGDPLMPALFALGQHAALVAIQNHLLPTERLLAFLDDLHVVAAPHRIAAIHHRVETELWEHARIRINQGEDPVVEQGWNIPSQV